MFSSSFLYLLNSFAQVIHAAKEATKVLNDTYFSMSYNAHRIQGDRPFKEAVPMYIDQCDSALFVALKPDDTDANPALLAKAILEEAAEGTWAKLEQAKREGECRHTGVSNYSAALLTEMKCQCLLRGSQAEPSGH